MQSNLVLMFGVILSVQCTDQHNGTALSRQKRYLAFPEGSTLSVAICMTAQTGITPGEIFTEAINWGITYDLPNDTKVIKDFERPEKEMKRRYRRDLYAKLETIMNSMGYGGRECILRALCEVNRQKDSLLDRILKIVFNFPADKLLDSEPSEHHVYNKAYQLGYTATECRALYPCPFSLIDLALGFYS